MTAKLPPLHDIEQVIYEKCRRFVTADVEKAVEEIVREQSLLAVRDALETALLRVMDYNDRDAIRALLKEYSE